MSLQVTDHPDGLSDYGSDFTPDEEDILTNLLHQVPLAEDSPNTNTNLVLRDIEDAEPPRGVCVPRRLGSERRNLVGLPGSQPQLQVEKRRVTLPLDNCSAGAAHVESPSSRTDRERSVSIEAPLSPAPETPDLRSPLERFRTKPRKTLSVTDLVSPSWCELQYWYVLTKHGKKRRTPAMRQGSVVHKTLEEQVHVTVQVDVTTKEDAWGLRIWNVIQGLKTLRETGGTRELEVWGTVDGEVVNGVIDELSTACPDRELEAADKRGEAKNAVPKDQTTITDFLGARTLEGNGLDTLQIHLLTRDRPPKVYITDVKTRGAPTIPKGASFRPTLMQLMLYYKLLSNLATNRVDASLIFSRHGLRPDAQFSDAFIAQIGSLNESYYSAEEQSEPSQSNSVPPSTQDSMTTLLAHNSLRSLWALMISHFALTMPFGEASLGRVLKAEYRTQKDGAMIGAKTFLYDADALQGYLDEEMRWWKGKREAQGVCLEEAYKCGYCEFAEECSWRKNKIEEATLRMRERDKSVV